MLLQEPFRIETLIYLYFYKDCQSEYKIERYCQHLFTILEKTLGINVVKFLNNSDDKSFLDELIELHEKAVTPLSGALEATLAYKKFPKIVDLTHDTVKFKTIIREIIKEFIVELNPELLHKELSITDLEKNGFDTKIKYDYDHCYDDYDW